MSRKICVVTGTRADYGLLYWLLKEIQADPALDLQIIATGMHLSPEFGSTVDTIASDGFPVSARVEMLLSSDTPVGTAKSIGLGVIGFADVFDRLQPDIVVLIGDRFETFAAGQAALMNKLPIAHIHGGELTQGAIDDALRHCLTKMAMYHFVAAEPYRQRVIQLGEQPDRVYNVGAPGLDNLTRHALLDRQALEQALGWHFGQTNFLVTYHPVTLDEEDPAHATRALLSALDQFPDTKIILTKPNADTGGRVIIRLLEDYATLWRDRVLLVTSLGQVRYLSAMQHVDVVIGNSSSGIIEAPLLKTPTVNIGHRQDGRLKAQSIVDCRDTEHFIADAIRHTLSPAFRRTLPDTLSLYGNGEASRAIKDTLKTVALENPVKVFYDIPLTAGNW